MKLWVDKCQFNVSDVECAINTLRDLDDTLDVVKVQHYLCCVSVGEASG